jgi:hypothetical protein
MATDGKIALGFFGLLAIVGFFTFLPMKLGQFIVPMLTIAPIEPSGFYLYMVGFITLFSILAAIAIGVLIATIVVD